MNRQLPRLMFALFALASFAGSLFASSLPLIPYPNQVEAGQGTLRVGARINIEVPSNDEEDRFAASLLVQDLNSLGGVAATVGAKSGGSPRIVLARSDSQAGKNILQKSGLSLPAQADDMPSLRRPRLSTLNAMWWPLPASPSRFSLGILQSCKTRGQVDEPRIPSCVLAPTGRPGVSRSIRNAVNFFRRQFWQRPCRVRR